MWYNIPMNASQNFKLKKEFVTLGQLAKACGFIASGGDAKTYLLNMPAKVNGVHKRTRKTKVFVGDVVEIENSTIYIVND